MVVTGISFSVNEQKKNSAKIYDLEGMLVLTRPVPI
jgi:hypothetical protein